VVEKLRIESADFLGRIEEQLWKVTRFFLEPYARFGAEGHSFTLERYPFPDEQIHPGPYHLGKQVEDANVYRIGHPLAQRILERCCALPAPSAEVAFRYGEGPSISALEPLVGGAGWLTCVRLTVRALETEDHLLFAGVTDQGEELESTQCRRLFDLAGEQSEVAPEAPAVQKRLETSITSQQLHLLDRLGTKASGWFDAEMDKLDRWADDRRTSLKAELDDLDGKIRESKRDARLAPTLPAKLDIQRQLRQLETKRTDAWKAYDEASRDVDRQKDALLDDISQRLGQQIERETLFTIRWRLEAA
jgi:hypothetical protein